MNIDDKKTALDDDSLLYQKRDESFGKKDISGMNVKEKAGYFKDYYLKIVLAVIAVAIIIGILIYTVFFHHQEMYLGVAIMNDAYMTDTDDLTADLRKLYGLTSDDQLLDVTDYDSDDYASQVRFTTYFAAQNIDVIICTEEDFERYSNLGYFADLSEFLPEELYEKVKDQIIESSETETDTDGNVTKTYPAAPHGIDISGNALYKAYGGTAENVIVGVAANSERADNVIHFLEYLL